MSQKMEERLISVCWGFQRKEGRKSGSACTRRQYIREEWDIEVTTKLRKTRALGSQIIRLHCPFQLCRAWMHQCKCLYWCLSGYPKTLFCASAPVTLPPWLRRPGQCTATVYVPNGENPLSSCIIMATTISENKHSLTKICLSHIWLGALLQRQDIQKMKCVIHTDTRPELPHLAKYDSYPQGETDLQLCFPDLWGLKN